MQKPTDELIAEINRVIKTPPSRPIRLMFLENEIFYEMAQNQVKDLFLQMNNEYVRIYAMFSLERERK